MSSNFLIDEITTSYHSRLFIINIRQLRMRICFDRMLFSSQYCARITYLFNKKLLKAWTMLHMKILR